MKKSCLLLAMFFLTINAQASLITVNDGDTFDYDENDTYQFTGALSSSNPILTYGVNVEPGEIFNFEVSAPPEFDLQSTLSTGPNGTGTGIITPNGSDLVYAGTSFDYYINGDYFTSFTHWLSIGIGPEAYPFINEVYGGSLGIDDISDYDQYVGGNTGGTGGTGATGATGSNSVPEPGMLLLFGAALAALKLNRWKNVKV